MTCNCAVCNGRNYNQAGIDLADKEVIPFVKVQLLKLKYPKHPFPMKYDGLLASLLCYSQAIAYDRVHKEGPKKYYTDNPWMLKFKDELNNKFTEVIITSSSEISLETLVREVCEYNT